MTDKRISYEYSLWFLQCAKRLGVRYHYEKIVVDFPYQKIYTYPMSTNVKAIMNAVKTDVSAFPFNTKGQLVINTGTYIWERAAKRVNVYFMGKLRCTVWV